MDQVKKLLAILKKHHFWVLSVIVLILLGAFYSTSAAKMSKDFQGRKSKLDGEFSNMQGIAGSVDPPNERVIATINRVHAMQFQNVMEGWRYLYDQQKKNNPLPGVLGDEFKDVWGSLEPDEEIPPRYRDTYWIFIRKYIPKILERVDVRRPKNEDALAGEAGAERAMETIPGGARDMEYVGKVVWDTTSYNQLLQRFNWQSQPTTTQIRLAQEDLWVYETLLNIIKEMNQDSTSHYNAVVKRIAALDVGKPATQAFAAARNSLGLGGMQAVAPGATPGMEGPPPGAMMEGPSMGMEGPGMMPGMPTTGRSDALYVNRYVTETEEPVPVVEGKPQHPYTEFKMMPIRISLLMDQRKVPELMVKCSNANMPIEVRQLRLNPGKATQVKYAPTGAAMSGMPGAFGEAPGAFGPAGPYGGGGATGMDDMEEMPGAMGRGGSGTEGVYRGPYDLPVEILGIIYIYERPNEQLLGKGPAIDPTAAQAAPGTPATPPPPTEPPEKPTPAGTPKPPGGTTPAPAGAPTGPAPAPGGPAPAPPGPASKTVPPGPGAAPGAPAPTG